MPENMSKEELRRQHRDTRRRQMLLRRRIFYAILIVLVLIIGLILSFTVFFNVSKIEVRGYSIYGNEEIAKVSGVEKGDNLFLINKSKVKEHITEKLPYIGDVEVKYSLPSKLVITVYETSVKCVAKSGGEYILLNENAKVLGTAAKLDDIYESAILEGGEKYVSEEEKAANEKAKAKAEKEASTTTTTKSSKSDKKTTTTTKKNTTTTTTTTKATTESTTKATTEKKAQYVLEDEDFIILKGVKIKSAVVGQTVEFSTEKALEIYTQIMNLFVKNEVTGITALDLSDVYNIVMRYEDRIDVKVGSITNIEDKMAFAAEVIKQQDKQGDTQEGIIDATLDDKAYFRETTKPTTTKATTGVPVTDKKGNVVTDKDGKTVTEKVTESTEKGKDDKQTTKSTTKSTKSSTTKKS